MPGLVHFVISASHKANMVVSCGSSRGLCTSLLRLQKAAPAVATAGSRVATAPATQGIPYTKLTIGVPKESWSNERR